MMNTNAAAKHTRVFEVTLECAEHQTLWSGVVEEKGAAGDLERRGQCGHRPMVAGNDPVGRDVMAAHGDALCDPEHIQIRVRRRDEIEDRVESTRRCLGKEINL